MGIIYLTHPCKGFIIPERKVLLRHWMLFLEHSGACPCQMQIFTPLPSIEIGEDVMRNLGHFLSTFGQIWGYWCPFCFGITSSEDRGNTIPCLISVFSLNFFASALIQSSTL